MYYLKMRKRDRERMQTGQREIRMMWLMGLTIVAIAAWFLAVPLLSALWNCFDHECHALC